MKKQQSSRASAAPTIAEATRDGQWLSTREASVRLSCSLSQVQKMVEAGDLIAWKTSGGHRRIPVDEVERVLAGRRAGVAGDAVGGPFRMVIAEDDEALQRQYARKLAAWDLPIEVEFARDGYLALLMIAKRRPDLIIMDLHMPRMDGYAAIQAIRNDRDFDTVQIIVVTGMAVSGNDKRLASSSVIFRKPVDFSKLNGFVQACIGRRRPARPAPA
jgi:excisionase family DNA binding protein